MYGIPQSTWTNTFKTYNFNRNMHSKQLHLHEQVDLLQLNQIGDECVHTCIHTGTHFGTNPADIFPFEKPCIF